MTAAPELATLDESRIADHRHCERSPDPDHGSRLRAAGALAARALARDPSRFEAGYNAVPAEIDDAVSREALETLSSVELG